MNAAQTEQHLPSRQGRTVSRRTALGALGAAAGATLAAACGSTPTSPSSTTAATTTPTTSTTTSTNGTCVVTPSETAGPYPSRGQFVRSDVREGKPGTPLTLTIKVVNASNGCAPVMNADVEIWHCDAVGDYSQYGSQT